MPVGAAAFDAQVKEPRSRASIALAKAAGIKVELESDLDQREAFGKRAVR